MRFIRKITLAFFLPIFFAEAVSAASVTFVTPVRDQASALGYAMANCIHTDILLVTVEGSHFDQALHAIHAGNAR